METDAHHGITGDIPAWRPSNADLPLGTAGLVRLPVDRVDGGDLAPRAGDRVGLVGRNGAGKTSLLKVLGGLAEQHATLVNNGFDEDSEGAAAP